MKNSIKTLLLFVAFPTIIQAQSFTRLTTGVVAQSSGNNRTLILEDLNNDSYLDLYFTAENQTGIHKHFLNINGDFINAPSNNGLSNLSIATRGAGIGDFDNDCNLDIVLANSNANNMLLLSSNGIFSPGSGNAYTLNSSLDIAWGDYNNDGWLDLFEANSSSYDNLYKNQSGINLLRAPHL